VLLQEIHHRVKNNLQVVSSLLFLQSERFSDPAMAACFLDSQSRICSMALAHEQLYQSKNLAEVNIKTYVESLVEELRQVYLVPRQEISWHVDLEEFVLDIEKVVPFGLLLTELLSNANKHAFTNGENGCISISVRRCRNEIVLAVADDGVGLPAAFDFRQAKTLGMNLLTALVSQLNGSLEVDQDHGTLFKVRFAS
jgi:two-component sensor histidine kinase